jgi:hypothetical protein
MSTTPWHEWKKRNLENQRNGKITPAALLNPDSPRVDNKMQEERMAICEACDKFMVTKQCSKCGCFMPTKTALAYAACPLEKWYPIGITL